MLIKQSRQKPEVESLSIPYRYLKLTKEVISQRILFDHPQALSVCKKVKPIWDRKQLKVHRYPNLLKQKFKNDFGFSISTGVFIFGDF